MIRDLSGREMLEYTDYQKMLESIRLHFEENRDPFLSILEPYLKGLSVEQQNYALTYIHTKISYLYMTGHNLNLSEFTTGLFRVLGFQINTEMDIDDEPVMRFATKNRFYVLGHHNEKL